MERVIQRQKVCFCSFVFAEKVDKVSIFLRKVMDYFHIDYAKMRYFCILCASAGFDYAL